MDNKNLAQFSEDFEDFFDSALCGYVITDADGDILRMNKSAAMWQNGLPENFIGKRFSDVLSVGGRIYMETHLRPLLLMQGYIDEVALELADTGAGKVPVFINGYLKKSADGKIDTVRFTLFRASDRRIYEENLQIAARLAEANLSLEKENAQSREQFIAVLGHDLRNPLGGIISAAQLLARAQLSVREKKLINVIETSSKRMHEMINNIIDLARGRLGGGIPVHPVDVDLQEILIQVSDELKVAFPEREIITEIEILNPVECDPGRIAQLVSNLLANAISHGSAHTPVILRAFSNDKFWQISVTNQGEAISENAIKHLFHPFHREGEQSSNGLGLGLYIASEIAKAHSGTLSVTSDESETCFTFRVNY